MTRLTREDARRGFNKLLELIFVTLLETEKIVCESKKEIIKKCKKQPFLIKIDRVTPMIFEFLTIFLPLLPLCEGKWIFSRKSPFMGAQSKKAVFVKKNIIFKVFFSQKEIIKKCKKQPFFIKIDRVTPMIFEFLNVFLPLLPLCEEKSKFSRKSPFMGAQSKKALFSQKNEIFKFFWYQRYLHFSLDNFWSIWWCLVCQFCSIRLKIFRQKFPQV